MTESAISFKLEFEDPLLVSNLEEIDHHSLYVEVLETELFTSIYGQEYEEKEIKEKLPLQVP